MPTAVRDRPIEADAPSVAGQSHPTGVPVVVGFRTGHTPSGDRGTRMDRAFVERADELARLLAIHAAAAEQGGRVVLVAGEAGSGKSELVRQFLQSIPDVSSHVGRCDDLATPMPLAPIHDIARDVPRVAAALSARDRGAVRDAVLGVLGPRDLPAVLVDVHWADEATLDNCHQRRPVDRE